MSRRREKISLIFSDLLFINLAWSIYYEIRINSGWIPYSDPAEFLLPLVVIYFYWVIIFSFSGLYEHWFVRSRFDELSSIIKTVSIGCFILFFAIFIDDAISNARAISRYLILIYWTLMITTVSIGRIIIRSFQINLLEKGIGLRNSVIIGNGQRSKDLSSLVNRYPQLGYKIIGNISLNKKSQMTNGMGDITQIKDIIEKNNISEVLIALETKEKEKLLDIIKYCPQNKVHLKIMPDTYEIVSGMVKTNQIYGVPLIEVMPGIMSHSAKLFKRIIDVIVSLMVLLTLSPILAIVSVLIVVTSKGGVFYKQVRIGKNGSSFTMYKFRSMIKNAEEYGPEWAGNKDPRITIVGRMLRKTYLDEVPQMINVLRNEMSLVGPRPERPHFVEMLQKEIPYYYKRLTVKPGITGWAQIKHKYDSSLDDVKLKLQYDFYYIENMSIKLDFKIIVNTIIVILMMKGH